MELQYFIQSTFCTKTQHNVHVVILHFIVFFIDKANPEASLIQTLRLSHCALDIERSHILPILLQQGHQEVDSKIDIRHKFILAHINMTNGHSKTEHLQSSTITTWTSYYEYNGHHKRISSSMYSRALWHIWHLKRHVHGICTGLKWIITT